MIFILQISLIFLKPENLFFNRTHRKNDQIINLQKRKQLQNIHRYFSVRDMTQNTWLTFCKAITDEKTVPDFLLINFLRLNAIVD